MFFKEGVLRNFAKFTRKHLSCGVFLYILQNFYYKVQNKRPPPTLLPLIFFEKKNPIDLAHVKHDDNIEDRIIRIKDYLKNIWTVRKYFIDKYGVDPPVISGDQMPLHRNESASQKTLSLKSEEVFVKENYMLS